MLNIVTPITLSAKKGDTQSFFFEVYQSIPGISIDGSWQRTWQDLGTLAPQSYKNAQGVRLLPEYTGAILWRGVGLVGDRRDNAGYETYEGHGAQRTKTLTPSPVFRGVPLGEIRFTVKPSRFTKDQGLEVSWNGALSSNDKAWLTDQLSATILATIEKHKDALRADAVAKIRERFADGVAHMRQDADDREEEARRILAIIG